MKYATEGNFLRTVRLFAEFDPLLNNILNDENQKIKYLSWSVQNELLDILSTELRLLICNNIRSSSFFSVILDSTQDITKQDQVSLVIRYTTIDFEKKQIQIKESFLGFYLLRHHGAENYVELLQNTLLRLDLNIMKCRGQGYDGAAVMSGSITGVQKRICDIVFNATFVHCCSHNINLVLCDAAKSTRKIQSFFDTVQDIYNFFSSSSPRWAQLAFGEEYGIKINKITLKKVCPTRWEARHNALFSLKHRFVDVLKALSNIQLSSSKKDEINMTTTLKKKMENAEFVIILCTWEPILKSLQVMSKSMQSVNLSLQRASTQLENAISIIEKLRNQYDQIVEDSKKLCMKWNIPFKLSETRQRFAKKYFEEVDSDRRLTTTDDNFRVTIFYPVVDTTLLQLRVRFKGMKTVCDDFDILMPEILTSMTDELIVKSSYDFIHKYKEDIRSDFTRQLIIIKGYLSSKFEINYLKNMSIHDLADTIVKEELTSIFPDVFIGIIIFLTIPVTSASAERSFSKLKLIKNYLRNSIGQERLSSIALLNIERQQINDLNIEDIIDNFANKKARKMNFLK